MMSVPTMKIALVISAINLNDPECNVTYNTIKSVIAENTRFVNVTVSKIDWEEPTDLSGFTHILFYGGLEYAHCKEKFLKWTEEIPECTKLRVFNPLSVIKWNMDKIYLLSYQKKGIRIPPSVFIKPGETVILENIVERLQEQVIGEAIDTVIIKKMVDAGGVSVQQAFLTQFDETQEILKKALENSPESGIVIQQFLPAIREEGEWSLIYFDRYLSHAALKRPASEGFKVHSFYGGNKISVELTDVPQDIIDFATDVITASEAKLLYARVDIVRDPIGRPCLMELEAFEPDLYITNAEIATNFLETLSKH